MGLNLNLKTFRVKDGRIIYYSPDELSKFHDEQDAALMALSENSCPEIHGRQVCDTARAEGIKFIFINSGMAPQIPAHDASVKIEKDAVDSTMVPLGREGNKRASIAFNQTFNMDNKAKGTECRDSDKWAMTHDNNPQGGSVPGFDSQSANVWIKKEFGDASANVLNHYSSGLNGENNPPVNIPNGTHTIDSDDDVFLDCNDDFLEPLEASLIYADVDSAFYDALPICPNNEESESVENVNTIAPGVPASDEVTAKTQGGGIRHNLNDHSSSSLPIVVEEESDRLIAAANTNSDKEPQKDEVEKEDDLLDMPKLLPHFESDEFEPEEFCTKRKRKASKKDPPKCRHYTLIDNSTGAPVLNRRQFWCKICDDYFLELEILRAHIHVKHEMDTSGLNEHTIATWDILHLVGLPPKPEPQGKIPRLAVHGES